MYNGLQGCFGEFQECFRGAAGISKEFQGYWCISRELHEIFEELLEISRTTRGFKSNSGKFWRFPRGFRIVPEDLRGVLGVFKEVLWSSKRVRGFRDF